MKTKEELNVIKEEVESLNEKLVELNDEELEQVTGGVINSPKFFSPLLRLLYLGTNQNQEGANVGQATLHNMPKIDPNEKYVMKITKEDSEK